MSTKPLILHLIYRFDIGGLEQVMIDTINRTHNQFDHLIITLTTANPNTVARLEHSIEVIELNKGDGNDLSLYHRLWQLFRSYRPRVLHSYNLPTLEYQFIAFLARIPLRIHAEHGRDISDPTGTNRKYRLLRQVINPFIHHWIAVSHDLTTWLTDCIGISARKAHLIHNGIDIDKFSPQPGQQVEQRLEGFASRQQLVIGTIGRLDSIKNHQLLVEVCASLKKTHPELINRLVFAIIGNGDQFHPLQQQIDSLKLNHHVWLPGARYQIPELIKQFDIFVLPSIAEGIPMTLLEAMASEKPVIATAVGGIPEVINDKTGILIPSGDSQALKDALLLLINDSDQRTALAKAARRHIKQYFSQPVMIARYRSLYEERKKG